MSQVPHASRIKCASAKSGRAGFARCLTFFRYQGKVSGFPEMVRVAPSFCLASRCRFSSKRGRSIACGREIFQSTHSRRVNRLARKFRGAISFLLVYPSTRPWLFQKRLPYRRQSHLPRRIRSNRRRNRLGDQNRRRTLCWDRSAEKLFPKSGSISPRNHTASLRGADRAEQDRARQTRTGADKKYRRLPTWRRSTF